MRFSEARAEKPPRWLLCIIAWALISGGGGYIFAAQPAPTSWGMIIALTVATLGGWFRGLAE